MCIRNFIISEFFLRVLSQFLRSSISKPDQVNFKPDQVNFKPGSGQFQTGSGQFQTGSGQFQTGSSQFQTGSGQFQTGSATLCKLSCIVQAAFFFAVFV